MTVAELYNRRVAATEVLHEIRMRGGLVLRVIRDGQWHLYMLNGARVPTELKFRLLELELCALVLLRELAMGREDLPL